VGTAAGTRVILYGDSLLLAGIRVQLQSCPEFELITVDAGIQGLPEFIRSFKPRVLLFDFALTEPDFAVPLLRDFPDLLLIGVDPSRDELLILTGKSAAASSMGDLVKIISEKTDALRLELRRDLA